MSKDSKDKLYIEKQTRSFTVTEMGEEKLNNILKVLIAITTEKDKVIEALKGCRFECKTYDGRFNAAEWFETIVDEIESNIDMQFAVCNK